MLIAWRERTFDSAHYLPDYDGPCGRLHGHTYRVQVGVTVDHSCPNEIHMDTRMIIDFKDLDEQIRRITNFWDHRCLNDLPEFERVKPTAEMMVLKIVELMNHWCQQQRLALAVVRLWETPNSCVEWLAMEGVSERG